MSNQLTLLIDSPNLLYRSYFGVPLSVVAKDGTTPVNAARGYLASLGRIMREWKAEKAFHVFDANWRPNWRVAIYPSYKAQRVDREEPTGLFAQFDIVKEILGSLGHPVASASDFEADDVIASLAVQATDAKPAMVVSGDRDFVSLIRDPAVSILYLTPTSQTVVYDEAAALEKFGVIPAQYTDYAILRGDASDNLPGVLGFGPRTSARLLRKYGSIDDMVKHLDEIAGAPARALRDAENYLQIARSIVPLRTDVVPDVKEGQFNQAEIDRLAELYNLRNSITALIGG